MPRHRSLNLNTFIDSIPELSITAMTEFIFLAKWQRKGEPGELNGKSIDLGESVFILPLCLAVGAKEEPGG